MQRKKLSWRQKIINPLFLLKLCPKLQLSLAVLIIPMSIISCWLILNSPIDYKQGITVKIMFLHIPSAWLSLFCYSFMAASAFIYLIWRHSIAYVMLKSALPIGTIFAIITIITGSFWGKPTWGTWWVWDARLTSFFILLISYLTLISLQRSLNNNHKTEMICCIFTLIGFINIPIIKYSVDWWYSLHQGASISIKGGSQIETSFLIPLLFSFITINLIFFFFLSILVQNNIYKQLISTYESNR